MKILNFRKRPGEERFSAEIISEDTNRSGVYYFLNEKHVYTTIKKRYENIKFHITNRVSGPEREAFRAAQQERATGI